MERIIRGPAIVLGDNIDTDVIIAARYLVTRDPVELAAHCLEDLVPDLAQRAANGAILAAGRNFGSGSSREHAPIALKAAGIRAVVAASFARIFFRNAFNIGLPLLTCGRSAEIHDGYQLEIDLADGRILEPASDRELQAEPLPQFMRELLEAGGLVNFIRQRVKP